MTTLRDTMRDALSKDINKNLTMWDASAQCWRWSEVPIAPTLLDAGWVRLDLLADYAESLDALAKALHDSKAYPRWDDLPAGNKEHLLIEMHVALRALADHYRETP